MIRYESSTLCLAAMAAIFLVGEMYDPSPDVMPLMLPPSSERMHTHLSTPALLSYGCALGNVKVGNGLICSGNLFEVTIPQIGVAHDVHRGLR